MYGKNFRYLTVAAAEKIIYPFPFPQIGSQNPSIEFKLSKEIFYSKFTTNIHPYNDILKSDNDLFKTNRRVDCSYL